MGVRNTKYYDSKFIELMPTAEPDGQTWGSTWDPPYCYHEGGTNFEKTLKFNVDGSNSGTCGRGEKNEKHYDRCLCCEKLKPIKFSSMSLKPFEGGSGKSTEFLFACGEVRSISC